MHLELRKTPAPRLLAWTYDAVPDWVASASGVSSVARDDVGVAAPPMHTADRRATALLTTVFLSGAAAAFPAVSTGAHMSSDNLAEVTLLCPARNGLAGLKEYTDCMTVCVYVCACACVVCVRGCDGSRWIRYDRPDTDDGIIRPVQEDKVHRHVSWASHRHQYAHACTQRRGRLG
jgi:hypothetical protein